MGASNQEELQDALFSRTARLVGRVGLRRLAACRVMLFGLGGVGSWCAEALVRSGVRHLTLVDSDVICPSNVNRQVQATAATIGQIKAEALRERLLEIHPHADITAVRAAFEESTCGQFDWRGHDYVVDAIDSLQNKVLLIEQCVRLGVKFYSSMGAAARMDASRVRVARLDQTSGCPLAREVRRGLRERQVPLEAVTCVYSLESALPPVADPPGDHPPSAGEAQADHSEAYPDWDSLKARTNGTAVHVTAVFGFMLAGLVIQNTVANEADFDRQGGRGGPILAA